MAYATKRGAAWAARWRDAAGHWRRSGWSTRARPRRAGTPSTRRRRPSASGCGLDPVDGAGDETFADLFTWWWTEYGKRRRSQTIESFARKNLLPGLASSASGR